jgi:Fe2+ or Zn2+ uptake regulation protein
MTYQTKLVLEAAKQMGHSTNSDILIYVRQNIPEVSATTVHRITTRLIKHGLLSYGPEMNGSRIVDANAMPHDHFVCKECSGIKDIIIAGNARQQIQTQVPNLALSSSLTITGDCDMCG